MGLGFKLGAWKQERGAWLLLLLLLVGVLAPTGAVFWFMNEAVRAQSKAAQQNVLEAYRGQLRLLRNRLGEIWRARAAALDQAADFPAALKASGAETVILLDDKGAPRYPAAPAPLRPDPTFERDAWAAARQREANFDHLAQAAQSWAGLAAASTDPSLAAIAAQGQIRCLVRMGQKAAAIAAIERHFGSGRLAKATDLAGRLVAADELLLSLQLMKSGDPRLLPQAQRLAALVNDYSVAMTSAQRLFVMSELRALVPQAAVFPLEAAERTAARYLEKEKARPGALILEASGMLGLWKLTSPQGRAIALYTNNQIGQSIAPVLDEMGGFRPGLHFNLSPPGTPIEGDSISTGEVLPGWQLSFSAGAETRIADSERRRMTAYLSVGYLVIAAIAISGVLIGQSVRREFRLARLKTDLVAAVSHELKTPVASMRLLVETLLEEPASPRKTREYLELIHAENQRLGRLIENFLTFSRIERNRQRFEFIATRPEEVVRDAMTAMRERLKGPECHVEVDVSSGLPDLQADSHALVTVLTNLLDNAYKYSPGEKRIRLSVSQQDGHVVFAVEDNGIGITAREHKRIFRRFYQVDQRLARETGGCGLGLSIVDFIVHAHGGKVTVASAPGSGSRFAVWLPYALAAREAMV